MGARSGFHGGVAWQLRPRSHAVTWGGSLVSVRVGHVVITGARGLLQVFVEASDLLASPEGIYWCLLLTPLDCSAQLVRQSVGIWGWGMI